MIFYASFYEAVRDLPDQDRLACLDTILSYGIDGVVPVITSPIVKTVFTLVKPQIDANNKRAESGKKGGRTPKDRDDRNSEPVNKTNGFGNEKPLVSENENHRLTESETIGYEDEKPKNKNKLKVKVEVEEKDKGQTETKKHPAAASAYVSDPMLDAAIQDFVDSRKKLRKPMTDKAIELFINKLNKLAPNDTAKQIELINTAIEHGWQTVYPPNEPRAKPASDDIVMRIARGEAVV